MSFGGHLNLNQPAENEAMQIFPADQPLKRLTWNDGGDTGAGFTESMEPIGKIDDIDIARFCFQ